jgi:hypothetical protein
VYVSNCYSYQQHHTERIPPSIIMSFAHGRMGVTPEGLSAIALWNERSRKSTHFGYEPVPTRGAFSISGYTDARGIPIRAYAPRPRAVSSQIQSTDAINVTIQMAAPLARHSFLGEGRQTDR